MLWIEMSRDEAHGGSGWEFGQCVWSPAYTRSHGQPRSWPYWSSILASRAGDTVVHLRWRWPKAAFVGVSTVVSGGFRTTDRPPITGEWDYSREFFRADLRDFTRFDEPLVLRELFAKQHAQLRAYFERNRVLAPPEKKHIFFVVQSGRLQCLNGAYFSEVDESLQAILFEESPSVGVTFVRETPADLRDVTTSSVLKVVRRRIGHDRFAQKVKENHGNACCFPGCGVNAPELLIAAHIERWADAEDARGRIDNGLAFCGVHDRAFELGLFVIDDEYRVHAQSVAAQDWVRRELLPHEGLQIRVGEVRPSIESLKAHRDRVQRLRRV